MAESIHWQIGSALVTALESISGDNGTTYWYTPDRVVRIAEPDRLMSDASIGHIVALMSGEETHTENSTGSNAAGGGVEATAQFAVLMIRRDETDSGDPFNPSSITREQVIDRMVRDCLRALWDDVTLGGLASNIADGSVTVDRDFVIEGPWAVAEVSFAVLYTYLSKTP